MTNEIIDFLILSLNQKMVNELIEEAWSECQKCNRPTRRDGPGVYFPDLELEDTEMKRFKEAEKQKKIKEYKAAIKELELLKDFNRE